jgi:hypothetical protein
MPAAHRLRYVDGMSPLRVAPMLTLAFAMIGCKSPLSSCHCPSATAAVCGKDGTTYQNDCFATCVGTTVLHTGTCDAPASCKCDYTNALVCGIDGATYINRCVAACHGVAVAEDGACPFTPRAGSQACTVDADCNWFGLICGGACYNKSDPPLLPPPCVGCPQPGCAGLEQQPCYCEQMKCVDPANNGLQQGASCDPARDLCQANELHCCGGDAGAPHCILGQKTAPCP